jgi:lambda repressor-like predicted transcriptional regulator
MPTPAETTARAIGLLLRAANDSGTSLAQLSERTGIPYATLRRKLRVVACHESLTLAEFARLAEALDLTPDVVIYAADHHTPPEAA